MRAWEIRQKRAQKRARELERKEKNKHAKETSTFRLVVAGRAGEPSVVESVIVKNPDESVADNRGRLVVRLTALLDGGVQSLVFDHFRRAGQFGHDDRRQHL